MLSGASSLDIQTLRKALPSWGEVAFWTVLLCCDHFLGGTGWWQAFKFIAPFFLMSRVVEVALFYVDARWPRFSGKYLNSPLNRVTGLSLIGVVVGCWIVFGGGWKQITAFRPDWGGALFILAFGAIIVVVLWPVYWLFERYIKPWAIRTNRHFLGFFGIVAIAALYWGAWLGALFAVVSRV